MKKFVNRFIRFIAILVIASYAFVWFYERPQRDAVRSGSSVKLQKWNSTKDNSNGYNILILGSSRAYSAYNPLVIDSLVKMKSFNMSTGSQHIIESYYMLKEIVKHQKPDYLVYEIFLPSFRTNPDLFHVFSNAKFMSNEMVLNEFANDKILDLIFPVYKYKAYLKNDLARFNFSTKQETQLPQQWIRGYRVSNKVNDSNSIEKFTPIDSFSNSNTLSKSDIEVHLNKLVQLCLENDIQPIFIRAPFPPSRLIKSLPDATNKYFSAFFEKQQLPFQDLNYNSSKTYSDYDFEDYHHLNVSGATKASNDLAIFINKLSHNQ